MKKRVHEIAKQEGLTSKEVLAALNTAGIEAKVAASSVEEDDALKALAAATGDGAKASPKDGSNRRPRRAARAEGRGRKARGPGQGGGRGPARRKAGDSAPAAGSGGRKRRRVVIDSQAARREHMPQAPPPRPPRRRGGRRRRPLLEEPPAKPVEVVEPEPTKVHSGATVREVAETLGLGSAEVIKKLMELGEMATLTQTLSDEAVTALAAALDQKVEIVSAAEEEPEEPVLRGRRGGPRRAAAGGHDHGPRRPRQDLAAGRDPRDQGGGRRGGRHHPAHRRLPGPPRTASRSPSSTRPATRRSPRCAPAAPRSPTSP